MQTIYLETFINAPAGRVFDLARSIDLHKLSAKRTREEAIAGRTTGLIELNETVTWRAKHFGIFQTLTVQIVEMNKPVIFSDTMIKGPFAAMTHTHKFEKHGNATKMIDVFKFKSPFNLLGCLADHLFLKRYMTQFLIHKNQELKRVAESEAWKKLLQSGNISWHRLLQSGGPLR